MLIKIAKSFQDNFLKDFKNHHIQIIDLVDALKKTEYIGLKSPIAKVKIFIKGIALRGLIAEKQKENEAVIVPLFFVLKSNKQYGDNLILDKEIQKIIDYRFGLYKKDFEEGKFEIY